MDPYRLAVIVGSTREGRFGPTVADWFADLARTRPGTSVDVLDLAGLPIPSEDFAASIGAADAVVVVTPEYNHSFPGPLKTAIDSVRDEWFAKPIAFVSYGGISGGLRAVEPLRGVFAELHAVTIRETVSFAMAWSQFDGEGQPKEPELVESAGHRLLDQLAWWAITLRAGRAALPYAG